MIGVNPRNTRRRKRVFSRPHSPFELLSVALRRVGGSCIGSPTANWKKKKKRENERERGGEGERGRRGERERGRGGEGEE